MPPKADRVLACPSCSSRVTGKEKACPKCGKVFGKGVKFQCPFCGAPVAKNSRRCLSCHMDLASIAEKEPETPGEQEQKSEEELQLRCPGCGEPLTGTELECPKCWRALSGRLSLNCPLCGTPIDKCLASCPICGTSIERMTCKADEEREVAETHPCPSCQSVIPDGLTTCPVCAADLTKPAVPEQSPAPAETPTEAPPEAPAQEGQTTPAPKPARQRKLKAKVTTVPAVSQPGLRGLTNGVGQINGLGKINGTGRVNGTGAVNGKAFVNGTGTTAAPSRRPSGAGRRAALRWQLLAVLIAVVIIVPTVMFLAFSNQGGKYRIDGDFEDWADATTFGALVDSKAAANNVTSWSVAWEEPNLYLFFRTQAPMMVSSSADGFYLFIDSDGSNSTGYRMSFMGADYMVQLSGWDSAVRSSLLAEHRASDRSDWSAWSYSGSVVCSMDGTQLEASATMPTALSDSARFLLVSKDSFERGSASCIAPLSGGVLIVHQSVAPAAASGVIPKAGSAAILTLTFTCDGEGGQVTKADPKCDGAPIVSGVEQFSLQEGQEKTITVSVSTSSVSDGQLVSAEMIGSMISSTFANVEIIGSGAKVYVGAPASTIKIDGAFADWSGRLSLDHDLAPVSSPNMDIKEVGNVSDSSDSFFCVGVNGELCSGTFIPALVAKPTSAGGTSVSPARRTAEDSLEIFIDSDKSNLTGKVVTLGSKRIGADQMIEVKGAFGEITSSRLYDYSMASSGWIASSTTIDAEKDERRIEIGVSATGLDGSSQIDFIVETTSWMGPSDFAIFDPSSMSTTTRTWLVDPTVTSPYATSMSYQRKMFFDGVNYWSIYFDGTDTVHKYSVDGQTWNYCGRVFSTSGVNETSIWFDSSSMTVYAVGDTSAPTQGLSVQVGSVDPAGHTISWTASDSTANVSRLPLAGKNAYISKDANDFLWILSTNLTQVNPQRFFQLSAFRSTVQNSTSSWAFSGNMIEVNYAVDNAKGTIVPAGRGSDMWSVYAFGGAVYSKKFTGSWQAQQTIYATAGSKSNTDNSPPSVVVDAAGVVHVVYGTGRRAGQLSTPAIEYVRNQTNQMTFTPSVSLDPLILFGVGDYYPTITLESTKGSLYALWLRGDGTMVPRTIMGSVCVAGVWSSMTLPIQTISPKFFLTSAYSVPDPLTVCWQWTENATIPVDVMFDGTMIPEFGDLLPPVFAVMTVLFVCLRAARRRNAR